MTLPENPSQIRAKEAMPLVSILSEIRSNIQEKVMRTIEQMHAAVSSGMEKITNTTSAFDVLKNSEFVKQCRKFITPEILSMVENMNKQKLSIIKMKDQLSYVLTPIAQQISDNLQRSPANKQIGAIDPNFCLGMTLAFVLIALALFIIVVGGGETTFAPMDCISAICPGQ